jgi:hypothetical protein
MPIHGGKVVSARFDVAFTHIIALGSCFVM